MDILFSCNYPAARFQCSAHHKKGSICSSFSSVSSKLSCALPWGAYGTWLDTAYLVIFQKLDLRLLTLESSGRTVVTSCCCAKRMRLCKLQIGSWTLSISCRAFPGKRLDCSTEAADVGNKKNGSDKARECSVRTIAIVCSCNNIA